jgi:nickel/cobalt transporter (NicO) family protein
MNATTPALIAAAAGVGFGHAILPDHWVPLAVVGRARRYPLARVARLSGLAGVAHVLVSLLLGGLIIAVGLQFRSAVEQVQNVIVGGALLLTGLAFIALELSGRGHAHEHEHRVTSGPAPHGGEHAGRERHAQLQAPGHDRGRLQWLASVMVPFGAAASPDLTILPVFLAAAAVGIGTAVGSLIAFAAATICTIVAATLIAASGGYRIRGRWLELWANYLTAAVLVVIGLLVFAGLI